MAYKCEERRKAYHKAYRAANKDKRKAWLEANKEKVKATCKAYQTTNKKDIKEKRKAWKKANRENINTGAVAYRKAHPEITAMGRRRYNLRSFHATPGWSESEEIHDLYLMRIEINNKYNLEGGERVQVDHIVPLQGKTVSGLHVIANLQLVDAAYNKSKNNKFNEE